MVRVSGSTCQRCNSQHSAQAARGRAPPALPAAAQPGRARQVAPHEQRVCNHKVRDNAAQHGEALQRGCVGEERDEGCAGVQEQHGVSQGQGEALRWNGAGHAPVAAAAAPTVSLAPLLTDGDSHQKVRHGWRLRALVDAAQLRRHQAVSCAHHDHTAASRRGRGAGAGCQGQPSGPLSVRRMPTCRCREQAAVQRNRSCTAGLVAETPACRNN